MARDQIDGSRSELDDNRSKLTRINVNGREED